MTDTEHTIAPALITQLVNSEQKGGIAGVIVAKDGAVVKYFTAPCVLASSDDLRAALNDVADTTSFLLQGELDTEAK